MEYTGTKRRLLSVIEDDPRLDEEKEYVCEIKEKKKKRSLDANAYYWQLLGKYADWINESKIRLHNLMLEHYGQTMTADGATVYAVLPDSADYLDFTNFHVRPTSQVKEGKDGKLYRTFAVLYGSHLYDSKEMSILIDGLIKEIQGSDAPIETMTPDELQKLKGYGYEVDSSTRQGVHSVQNAAEAV